MASVFPRPKIFVADHKTAGGLDHLSFLMHVLPQGFHRIRYYGFLTCQTRAKNIARMRELLAAPLIPVDAIKALNPKSDEPKTPERPCPCCGGPMRIIETFLRGQ